MLKTTSREMSEKLVKAGWVKETDRIWIQDHETGKWETFFWGDPTLDKEIVKGYYPDWLPAPTADEIAEGVSLENMYDYFCTKANPETEPIGLLKWLYTTRNSADAMAEVWMAIHGKRSSRKYEITNPFDAAAGMYP